MRGIAVLVLVAFALVVSVDGLTIGRLQSALEAHVGTESQGHVQVQGDSGSFVPPRTRLCVMYTSQLKHDDDGIDYTELQPSDVGQLPDGTTYVKDLSRAFTQQDAPPRYAPCVLVNLEGDLLNTQGQIISKFKLGNWYPTPPCLGASHRKPGGLFSDATTVNSAGNKCTQVGEADQIWIKKNTQWYAKPQDIPPQAASQKPVNTVALDTLPRQRLCVLYTTNFAHGSDSPFDEYSDDTNKSLGTLKDGTNYGKDIRQPSNAPPRYSRCTLVTLEGDIVDVKGKILSKFKTNSQYPTPPCLGSVKNAFLGGYKNVMGHPCTPPVGDDIVWTDWSRTQWYPSPDAIPLLKK